MHSVAEGSISSMGQGIPFLDINVQRFVLNLFPLGISSLPHLKHRKTPLAFLQRVNTESCERMQIHSPHLQI